MWVSEDKDIKQLWLYSICSQSEEETSRVKRPKAPRVETNLDGINSILVIAKEKNSELEDMAIETTQNKTEKKNFLKHQLAEGQLQVAWHTCNWNPIRREEGWDKKGKK